MTIGELGARTHFTAKAIRYYESIGLLPKPERTEAGYRLYGHDAVARLGFIGKAKQLGLSLDEIADVLALHDAGSRPCEHVLALLDRHIANVDATLGKLTEFRRQLGRLRAGARRRGREEGFAVCRIIEHASLADPTPPRLRRARAPS